MCIFSAVMKYSGSNAGNLMLDLRRLNWLHKGSKGSDSAFHKRKFLFKILIYADPITEGCVLTTLIIYSSSDWGLKGRINNLISLWQLENFWKQRTFAREIRGDHRRYFPPFQSGELKTSGSNNGPGFTPSAGVNPAAGDTSGLKPTLTFWCPQKQNSELPAIITILCLELYTILPATGLARNQRRPLAPFSPCENLASLSGEKGQVCERDRQQTNSTGMLGVDHNKMRISH